MSCAETPCTYRALFDAVEDIVYIRDLQGVILDINLAGQEFFGKPKSEIVGKTLHEDPVDDRAMGLLETNLSLMEAGRDRSTLELVGADGARRLFDVRTTILRDRTGRAVGAYGIMREVPRAAASPLDADATHPRRAEAEAARGLGETTPFPHAKG